MAPWQRQSVARLWGVLWPSPGRNLGSSYCGRVWTLPPAGWPTHITPMNQELNMLRACVEPVRPSRCYHPSVATSHCKSSATQSLESADAHWLLSLPGIGLLPSEAGGDGSCSLAATGSALLQCSLWGKGTLLSSPAVPLTPPCIAGDGGRGRGTTQLLLTTHHRQRMRVLMFR